MNSLSLSEVIALPHCPLYQNFASLVCCHAAPEIDLTEKIIPSPLRDSEHNETFRFLSKTLCFVELIGIGWNQLNMDASVSCESLLFAAIAGVPDRSILVRPVEDLPVFSTLLSNEPQRMYHQLNTTIYTCPNPALPKALT